MGRLVAQHEDDDVVVAVLDDSHPLEQPLAQTLGTGGSGRGDDLPTGGRGTVGCVDTGSGEATSELHCLRYTIGMVSSESAADTLAMNLFRSSPRRSALRVLVLSVTVGSIDVSRAPGPSGPRSPRVGQRRDAPHQTESDRHPYEETAFEEPNRSHHLNRPKTHGFFSFGRSSTPVISRNTFSIP